WEKFSVWSIAYCVEPSRLQKSGSECFDMLSMNGQALTINIPPFVLSPVERLVKIFQYLLDPRQKPLAKECAGAKYSRISSLPAFGGTFHDTRCCRDAESFPDMLRRAPPSV